MNERMVLYFCLFSYNLHNIQCSQYLIQVCVKMILMIFMYFVCSCEEKKEEKLALGATVVSQKEGKSISIYLLSFLLFLNKQLSIFKYIYIFIWTTFSLACYLL